MKKVGSCSVLTKIMTCGMLMRTVHSNFSCHSMKIREIYYPDFAADVAQSNTVASPTFIV